MTDIELQKTCEQQLRTWIEEYRTTMLRICIVYLSDVSQAEDAVQETFLKAWKSSDSFEGRNGCSEKTWLISIAINTCRSMLRTRWFRHIDTSKSIENLPFEAISLPPEDRDLLIDITRLPEKYKSVLLLYYYQDMTQQEIADILGISRSLVDYRLHKALNKLKITLREEERS